MYGHFIYEIVTRIISIFDAAATPTPQNSDLRYQRHHYGITPSANVAR